MNQAVYVAFAGASHAGGTGDLPAGLFLSVCEDEASAFEMMVAANNGRAAARMARGQQSGYKSERLF